MVSLHSYRSITRVLYFVYGCTSKHVLTSVIKRSIIGFWSSLELQVVAHLPIFFLHHTGMLPDLVSSCISLMTTDDVVLFGVFVIQFTFFPSIFLMYNLPR